LGRCLLTVKTAAPLAYIVLGTITLKRGRKKAFRAGSFAAAVCAFGYIVDVALTKNPFFVLPA
jgi:uncharacterized membrane protein SirB2